MRLACFKMRHIFDAGGIVNAQYESIKKKNDR